jgi:ribosome-associated translation inhibitor RaiA
MRFILKGDDRCMALAKQAKAQLQVELALGHFGEQVQSVVLRFSPGTPSRGPATQRCQIVVDIKPRRVRVEHTDVDLAVAIERATAKAARSIARVLDSERLKDASKVVRLTQPAAPKFPKRSARVG